MCRLRTIVLKAVLECEFQIIRGVITKCANQNVNESDLQQYKQTILNVVYRPSRTI
jgi:hypothetical protein